MALFNFLKKTEDVDSSVETQDSQTITREKTEKKSVFTKLRDGLKKTRSGFGEGLGRVFLGRKHIDEALFEELETQLLTADLGVETSEAIIQDLTEQNARNTLNDPPALYAALKCALQQILAPVEQPLSLTDSASPQVILMVGVNGAGKTTTIGKLAKSLQLEGKQVMLAAGDTFRAAAVEQLQVWGERNQIPVVAQQTGADSASVIFDAFSAAKARGVDVLIADTAGRLHTKNHLMEELKKIIRVMKKLDPSAPHEVMLVIDAGMGQNALQQALQFNDAVPLSGITLTKLDGTAKGGIIFAVAARLKVPIRFIGIGENVEDLRVFSANEFVDALFDTKEIA